MIETWQHIYEHMTPVAFEIFSVPVHWYGMMYVLALLSALSVGKYFLEKDDFTLTSDQISDYFIWIEIGIILGARLGYILVYDPHTEYYLTHPWQIFNPFDVEGNFTGIRGMSYYGAVIGWFLGSYFYYLKTKAPFGQLMDIVALAVPLGYMFGRIGNFLNQELFGRATDVPWGIYVDGVMRHPSQLYEGFLEGFVTFVIIFLYRKHKNFSGELILLYGFLYGSFRFLVEFVRNPDPQLGYIAWGWLTMGQIQSSFMIAIAVVVWIYYYKKLAQKVKYAK